MESSPLKCSLSFYHHHHHPYCLLGNSGSKSWQFACKHVSLQNEIKNPRPGAIILRDKDFLPLNLYFLITQHLTCVSVVEDWDPIGGWEGDCEGSLPVLLLVSQRCPQWTNPCARLLSSLHTGCPFITGVSFLTHVIGTMPAVVLIEGAKPCRTPASQLYCLWLWMRRRESTAFIGPCWVRIWTQSKSLCVPTFLTTSNVAVDPK